MNNTKKILIAAVLLLSNMSLVQAQGKDGPKLDTAAINKILQESKKYFSSNHDSAILLANEAIKQSERIKYDQGKAIGLKNIGIVYYYQGKYLETLDHWTQSLKIYEQIKDEVGVANLLNNIGAVYGDQGDDSKALEYSLKSLSISERLGDKERVLSALNTIANVYFNKETTMEKALGYLQRALPLTVETNKKEYQGVILENIGEIYFKQKKYDSAQYFYQEAINVLGNTINSTFAYDGLGKIALEKGKYAEALSYHRKGLDIAEKLDAKLNKVRSLHGTAKVHIKQNNYSQAMSQYKAAENLALELESLPNLKDLYGDMAKAYQEAGDYRNAFAYQKKLDGIKDRLFNETTERKLGTLQLEFDMEKKQNQINLLTKDNDLQALNVRKQRLQKNAFMAGLLLLFFIALQIFRSYRVKARTSKILNRQKNEIQHLLLNILPAEVAQELQEKGSATPRQYDHVSVMFTDFKGFTIIADNMSPQELVQELSACFIAFDAIMEKYDLEKIKTIGDSYMCAGGIPTPSEDHVLNIVRASLEIQQFIRDYNKRRIDRGLATWEARVGVHVGPLVAGVVGKKKYAYDIWGSTVNIASRMESNGMPGKVNISSAIYEIIKDKFECSYRGKLAAKNVGEVDMYFVEREKVDASVIEEAVVLEEKKL